MNIEILKKLGFSDKYAKIYLALLQLGPSSVRKLAEFCDLNRGTTYDALKWLKAEGVVTFYQKETKQYFVAEKPEKLLEIIKHREEELQETTLDLERIIPELQALHSKDGDRPVARYYAADELLQILEDVLETCEHSNEKTYRIYSTEGVREFLYEDFPTFSDARIAKGIIAIGEGGELRGLDERKWLLKQGTQNMQIRQSKQGDNETYIILYPGKSAYISIDAKGEPVGVVIENDGVYETQKLIFDSFWEKL